MLADGIPILMRLINGKRFEPGPFNLGRFGPYLGSLAVLWVIFITVCTPSLPLICCLCADIAIDTPCDGGKCLPWSHVNPVLSDVHGRACHLAEVSH